MALKPKVETFLCGRCEERKAYKDLSYFYYSQDDNKPIRVCLDCSPNKKKKPSKDIDVNEQTLF